MKWCSKILSNDFLVWHTLNFLKVFCSCLPITDEIICCGWKRVYFLKRDLHNFKCKFNVCFLFAILCHLIFFLISWTHFCLLWFLETATGWKTKAKQQLSIFHRNKKRLLPSLTLILNLKLLTYLSYQVAHSFKSSVSQNFCNPFVSKLNLLFYHKLWSKVELIFQFRAFWINILLLASDVNRGEKRERALFWLRQSAASCLNFNTHIKKKTIPWLFYYRNIKPCENIHLVKYYVFIYVDQLTPTLKS